MGISYSAGPGPSPLLGRTAYLFLDLGWLRCRGSEIFREEKQVSAEGLQRFISEASQSDGNLASTLRRAYVYDAAPDAPTPHRWQEGDPEPGIRPRDNHLRLAAADQIIMRYGRLLNGRQKGVDTRLVADLIRYAFTGVCDVAHVMTNDTDFVGPIQLVSDIGVQVVLYEIEEDTARLHGDLRGVADRVVTLDLVHTADLFEGIPRYEVTAPASAPHQAVERRVLEELHQAGYRRQGLGELEFVLSFRGEGDLDRARNAGCAYVGLAPEQFERWQVYTTAPPFHRPQTTMGERDPAGVVRRFLEALQKGPT